MSCDNGGFRLFASSRKKKARTDDVGTSADRDTNLPGAIRFFDSLLSSPDCPEPLMAMASGPLSLSLSLSLSLVSRSRFGNFFLMVAEESRTTAILRDFFFSAERW